MFKESIRSIFVRCKSYSFPSASNSKVSQLGDARAFIKVKSNYNIYISSELIHWLVNTPMNLQGRVHYIKTGVEPRSPMISINLEIYNLSIQKGYRYIYIYTRMMIIANAEINMSMSNMIGNKCKGGININWFSINYTTEAPPKTGRYGGTSTTSTNDNDPSVIFG